MAGVASGPNSTRGEFVQYSVEKVIHRGRWIGVVVGRLNIDVQQSRDPQRDPAALIGENANGYATTVTAYVHDRCGEFPAASCDDRNCKRKEHPAPQKMEKAASRILKMRTLHHGVPNW